MNPRLFFTTLVISFFAVTASAQNIASPTANLMLAPTGSLVIAMDNDLQSAPGGEVFNLKSYGLVVTLINSNKKVRWTIKTGKAKDGIDFSANASKMYPSTDAGVLRNFKGGPFVIFAADTAGCGAIINSYNAALNIKEKVNVYKLVTGTQVDVRYTYFFTPLKAGILNNGGKASIQIGYMESAGIPTKNYSMVNGLRINDSCFTFASEPHNGNSGSHIDSVKKFIMRGGNFLAECAAIITYENYTPTGGFQTTGGYDNVNTDINDEVQYPQSDLAYIQVNGLVEPKQGGNTQTFKLNTGASHKNDFSAITKGTAHSDVYGASISRLPGVNAGGYVFYLGNHEYKDDKIEGINGIRMYLNAFLTPGRSTACPDGGPLPVSLSYFDAKKTGAKKVELTWATATEINSKEFIVERSDNGISFHEILSVAAKGNSITESVYNVVDVNPVSGKNFYRLRGVDRDGKTSYSAIRLINFDKNAQGLMIFPNPASSSVTISFPDFTGTDNRVALFDLRGQALFVKEVKALSITIDIQHLSAGTYIVKVTGKDGQVSQQKLLIN